MYPVEFRQKFPVSWEGLTDLPQSFEERIPTLERRLDQYFEQHFQAILEEWDLLTSRDLRVLEDRIEHVRGEIAALQQERQSIEDRIDRVKREIGVLEEWSR